MRKSQFPTTNATITFVASMADTIQPIQPPRGLTISSLLNPPLTPKKHHSELTREQYIEIQALQKYTHWTYTEIASKTPYTYRQVQQACTGPVTPQKKKCGRRKLLATPQKEKLQLWILQDGVHRQIPWSDLRYFLPPELSCYGEVALTTALRSLGYRRAIQPRRIKRTEANKRSRVAFVQAQLRLRPRSEDWEDVGFSDETWATTDPLWKRRITIHDTEDPESFALLRRKPHGWMFWGQFAGRQKGVGFFWEKEWGGISAHKYTFLVVPLIARFYRDSGLRIYQQDNAPSHAAKITRETFRTLGIKTLQWPPPNSPDLNPIENVWFWLKDWVERNYNIQGLKPPELRLAVEAAWEAVPEEFLLLLAHSMVGRLQTVI